MSKVPHYSAKRSTGPVPNGKASSAGRQTRKSSQGGFTEFHHRLTLRPNYLTGLNESPPWRRTSYSLLNGYTSSSRIPRVRGAVELDLGNAGTSSAWPNTSVTAARAAHETKPFSACVGPVGWNPTRRSRVLSTANELDQDIIELQPTTMLRGITRSRLARTTMLQLGILFIRDNFGTTRSTPWNFSTRPVTGVDSVTYNPASPMPSSACARLSLHRDQGVFARTSHTRAFALDVPMFPDKPRPSRSRSRLRL